MAFGYTAGYIAKHLIRTYLIDKPTVANTNNMRFDGNIIYSYSYGLRKPIGRYIDRRSEGKNNMGLNLLSRDWLIANDNPSHTMTTKGQISLLIKHIPKGKNREPVMCLNVLAQYEQEHNDNIKAMLSSMDLSIRKARASRKPYMLTLHTGFHAMKRANLHRYCKLFKMKVPRTPIAANDKRILVKKVLHRLSGQHTMLA